MRTVLILLATTWALNVSWAQTSACFADWSAASAVVKSQGLMTLDQLTKLAPAKLGGEIVRSALCEGENGHVYRLVIRNREGQLKTVVVDAKHPF